MNDKVKIVVAVVCIVLAIIVGIKFSAGSKDSLAREGFTMMCQSCRYIFSLDKEDFREQTSERMEGMGANIPPLECPECGEEEAIRANKCRKCDNIFLDEDVKEDAKFNDACPKCGFSEIERRFGGK